MHHKKHQVKKICLITPGHLSSDPRLVKEATSLHNAGYDVQIVYTQYMDYLVSEDIKIMEQNSKWSFKYFIWTKSSFLKRFLYGIIHKVFLSIIDKKTDMWHYLILNRNYHIQLRNAIIINADLYIAHNLAALPIAVNAAKKNNAKCGFDAEDFHRNEVTNNAKELDVKIKSFIEDKNLKEVDYFTAASPLIAKAYDNLYPNLKPIVINNVFELKHQPPINLNKNEGLKLFWFSQTIGKNRGLEDVIEALNLINNPSIALHLLGNLSPKEHVYFNHLAKFEIQYYQPISADEIFDFAAQFDIGLALEPGFCLNNEIALSNKVFTYLTSGLAIIASKTQAQEKFMRENDRIGLLYPSGEILELSNAIRKFYDDKIYLNECKRNAYQLAQVKYNWEMESKKFIEVIKNTLDN